MHSQYCISDKCIENIDESLDLNKFLLLGLNTASIYKQFAATSTALSGDQFQAFVGGLGAIFNGSGRLLWGSLSDAIGFKKSFILLTLLQMVSMITYLSSSNSKV